MPHPAGELPLPLPRSLLGVRFRGILPLFIGLGADGETGNRGAGGPRRALSQKRTEDYRHQARTNNPERDFRAFDQKVDRRIRYKYDPHLNPQLVWASKTEHASFEVDTVFVHIHDRVSTLAILKALQREDRSGRPSVTAARLTLRYARIGRGPR